MKAKRPICDVHGEILKLAEALMQTELPKGHKRGVRLTAQAIVRLAKEAKAYGQKMENRLWEYRDVIEGLGFERDKKR